MATLAATDGSTIDTDSLPSSWCDELIETVAALDPVFDPLEEEDAEVDPGVFQDELISYARGLFGLKGKAPDPPVFFKDRGRIGHTAYWVFETAAADGDTLYLFLLRKGAVTEIACGEKLIDYTSRGGEGPILTVDLTPAQGALLEFCTMDFAFPRDDSETE
jgi:hypothetical protein